MPSDDVILNLKQIAGYTPSAPAIGDTVVVQRGGLGGPYVSYDVQSLVSTALIDAGPMSVGNAAPADTAAPQLFTDGLGMVLEGQLMWNCYVGGGQEKMVGPGPGGRIVVGDDGGMVFQSAADTGAGTPADFLTTFDVTPEGYMTVADQVLLGRDPAGPLEAATAQWVSGVVGQLKAMTVWSFNGRRGDVRLWIQDITAAGGAPQFSPAFSGEPRAPTPPPWSCNSRIATTAFAQRNTLDQINHLLVEHPFVFTFNGRTGDILLTPEDIGNVEGALLNSPALYGVPTAPTAPTGTDTAQLATCEFVNASITVATTALSGVYAPINSPAFTGIPTALTQPPGTSTGALATTAFVMNAVAESVAGVATFNGRAGNVTLDGQDISGAGGALLDSPVFSGTPTGPTAPLGANTAQLATCSWVLQEIGGANIGVMTFNGRGGVVVLNTTDIITAGGAPAASPSLSGVPTAPTAASGVSTNQIATTAFVMDAVTTGAGVTSFNGRNGAVTLNFSDISAAGGLANPSPALTGSPTAPTAPTSTNNTVIASTAFVYAAIAAAAVTTFNGRTGSITLTGTDITTAGGALLASPVFTGNPQAPTALAGDSSNALATTAFVANAIAGVGSAYLPLGGGTLTGQLIISQAASLFMQGAAGTTRAIFGRTGASTRWGIVMADGGAESGSNAGSNWSLWAYADDGVTPIGGGSVLGITRASKTATFSGPLNAGNGLAVTGSITATGNVTSSSGSFVGQVLGGTVYAGYPGATDFYLQVSGAVRALAFRGSVYNLQLNNSTGTLSWFGNSTAVMNLTYTGDMSLAGGMNVGGVTCTALNAQSGGVSCGSMAASSQCLVANGTGAAIIIQNANGDFGRGTLYAINFTQTSDPSLKTFIAPDPTPALTKVAAIPVHRFVYRSQPTKPRIGFDAKEVQAELPDAVDENPNDQTLGVSVNSMLATLWKAVQELSSEVATLRARPA